ncbi:MAG TPA: hypothetical protein VEA37_09660 [Flavobacterium sp.]|nr:hypothetical protein [Flavobacterium sp.]
MEQFKKYAFNLNLQHFGGADDEPAEEFEVEDEVLEDGEEEAGVEIETEDDDGIDDDETGDKELSDEEEHQEEVEKQVPLKALQAERRKWQEKMRQIEQKAQLADRFASLTGVDAENMNQYLDHLEVNNQVENGVPEHVAQALVQQQRQIQTMWTQLNQQNRDNEVNTLKADPFYADIEDFREEIENYANHTGISMKQAYMAVRGEQRVAEYAREVEQRTLLNKAKKQAQKVDTSISGDNTPAPKVKLTTDQMAIAKMAGMTPQEYYKYLKG